ncbi:MAG: hypothetical protein E6G64_01605 [Actinobacteria bacterium]|nr:MAG: hypothetical protein E6G64_01605 [Actinomycetota bacterium]
MSRRGQFDHSHAGTLRRGAIAELGGTVALVSFLVAFEVFTDTTLERLVLLGIALPGAAAMLYGSVKTVGLAEKIEQGATAPEPAEPEVLRWLVRFLLEQILVTGLIAGYFFAAVGLFAGLAALVVCVSLWAAVWLLLFRRWSRTPSRV